MKPGTEAAASNTPSVRFQEEGWRKSGGLVLRLCAAPNRCNDTGTVVDRLRRAAEWALDLDAQYRDLLLTGRAPRVTVPARRSAFTGRVDRETIASYRKLQLGVGALIRPLLLERPTLSELYPFQRHGVDWLLGHTRGILADDMGLGKTVQVISAMRLLFNRAEIRTALVVCPKSLIAIWEREFAQWAPELSVTVLTPPAGIRDDAWRSVAPRRHVVVTNYEQLRVPPVILIEEPPGLVVADEAHRLRNYDARVTAGCFQLAPGRYWALTGTPIERDAEDLATLLSLVAPKSFAPGDAKKLHPASLRSRAEKYVLRRRKFEVLNDLPDVLDTTEVLELTDEQDRAYRNAVRQHRQASSRANELALLTTLQALCDLEPDSRESCKLDRILYTLVRIRDQGEKAVVFSRRLEPLRELQHRVATRWSAAAAEILVGDMDSKERDRAVTRFRNDPEALALLASSQVGGEGLTLVEANHVFMLNQWWNPSANDQARDRVVRIGQQKKVRVYRFCCRDTIEEALGRILKSKRKLFDDVVERLAADEGAAWSAVLHEVGMDRLISPPHGAESPSGSSR